MEEKSGWLKEFDALLHDTSLQHLHQYAGWKDIKELEHWRRYVKSVINGRVGAGAKVFEAGCGVLAFLDSVKYWVDDIEIYGIDGASEVVDYIKNSLLSGPERNNFSLGVIPDALTGFRNDYFDVVLANSVFQYLPSLNIARRSVTELLRICKPRGSVIISDVCDLEFMHENEMRMHELWENYGTDQQPGFLYFSKEWFLKNFGNVCDLEIYNSVEERYLRRRERFNVYLTRR